MEKFKALIGHHLKFLGPGSTTKIGELFLAMTQAEREVELAAKINMRPEQLEAAKAQLEKVQTHLEGLVSILHVAAPLTMETPEMAALVMEAAINDGVDLELVRKALEIERILMVRKETQEAVAARNEIIEVQRQGLAQQKTLVDAEQARQAAQQASQKLPAVKPEPSGN